MRVFEAGIAVTGANVVDPAEIERDGRLAIGIDGITWTKPNLGLVQFRGSKANNFVPDEKL